MKFRLVESNYDYKTISNANGNYIDVNKIDSVAKDTYDDIKSGRIKDAIVQTIQMSPKEYLEACAEIFNTSYDVQIKQMQGDKGVINDLVDVVLNQKKAFPMPYLNYISLENEGRGAQEGRHRMYTLGKLFGFDKKYPVMILKYIDSNKQKELYKQHVYNSEIETIEEVLRDYEYSTNRWEWNFNDLSDVLQDIGYELNKRLVEHYPYTFLDFEIKNGLLVAKYKYKDYLISYYIDDNDEDNCYIERIEVK